MIPTAELHEDDAQLYMRCWRGQKSHRKLIQWPFAADYALDSDFTYRGFEIVNRESAETE